MCLQLLQRTDNVCVYVILFPSNRQHLIVSDCLEDKREDHQNCSVRYYFVVQLCMVILILMRALVTDELGLIVQVLCVSFS